MGMFLFIEGSIFYPLYPIKTVKLGKEKKEILSLIDEYSKGLQNRSVVLSLFWLLAQKYEVDYLIEQYLFDQYPKELKLHLVG